jgi:WD40-like Beta Propeller Repeat
VVKLLAIIGATTALTCGMAASAAPVARAPMLSFTISRGVSDSGLNPLGGGICLGNKRVTDPKADGGIAWSPDGSRIAFYRQTGPLTADVFVADADGSHLHNLTNGTRSSAGHPTGLRTEAASST